ncbi:MAG: hypothetical protein COA79_17910 [Planctomycetota bacterium]|nr:MAG: hypothetical protein COA79_17910 [Planctomycetota bacterium]
MTSTDGENHPIIQCYLNFDVWNNLDLLKEKISPKEYAVLKIQKQLREIIESDIKKSEKIYNKAVSELNKFLFKTDMPDHNFFFFDLLVYSKFKIRKICWKMQKEICFILIFT